MDARLAAIWTKAGIMDTQMATMVPGSMPMCLAHRVAAGLLEEADLLEAQVWSSPQIRPPGLMDEYTYQRRQRRPRGQGQPPQHP